MATQELMSADKIWQNEKSVFLSVTAFNLMRHIKHHCNRHNTECCTAHLQSELSSIHVTTAHMRYNCTHALQLHTRVTTEHTRYNWTHTLQLHIRVTTVHTRYNCIYTLQLHIHVTTAHTRYNCTYTLQLYIHITTAHTRYNCTYMLQLYIQIPQAILNILWSSYVTL